MTSRQKQNEAQNKQDKKGATIEEIENEEEEAPKPKKEFVRVAIEESSDEEEEGTITSKFPLKSLKEVEEHAKMAKKLMQQGGDAFMRKFEERAKSQNKIELIEETPKKEETKKEKKPSKAEIELQKAKEEADQKRKEIEETKKKEAELIEQVEKQKKLVEEAAKAKAESDLAAKKADEDAAKAQKEFEKAQEQVKDLGSKLTEMNPADLLKMEKQRPKIDGIVNKVETKKTSAAEKFKLGQYGEAVKAYQQAT